MSNPYPDYKRNTIAVPARKRPQNCGTSYCSCIECVMEPAQQRPVAWAWRAFNPDEGHYGEWGSWKIADYAPPRQPSQWFQVVPLPSSSPPAQRKPLTPDLEADTGYSRDERAAFTAGWEAAEAAHNIKENT